MLFWERTKPGELEQWCVQEQEVHALCRLYQQEALTNTAACFGESLNGWTGADREMMSTSDC